MFHFIVFCISQPALENRDSIVFSTFSFIVVFQLHTYMHGPLNSSFLGFTMHTCREFLFTQKCFMLFLCEYFFLNVISLTYCGESSKIDCSFKVKRRRDYTHVISTIHCWRLIYGLLDKTMTDFQRITVITVPKLNPKKGVIFSWVNWKLAVLDIYKDFKLNENWKNTI